MRGKTYRTKKAHSIALTNLAEAVKGEIACIDTSTGKLVATGTSTTLLPIGWFTETVTGDGTTKTLVDLFEEIVVAYFDNDSAPNAVEVGDIGSECYLKDGGTVSMLGTGRSKAGRVIDVDAIDGVGIIAGNAVTGPTGAAGLGADSVADRTALAAIAAGSRFDGMLVVVQSDGSLWRYVLASTLTTDEAEEFAIEPAVGGVGCWLRADKSFIAKIPIDFSMADGATILTVPADMALRLTGLPFWEVTDGFVGGTGSAIAIASDVTGYSTAGDILGGASGDVTATLGTAGVKAGTIGAKLDSFAEHQAFVLTGGDTLTYEELTDAFTAGAGFVCLPVSVMLTA